MASEKEIDNCLAALETTYPNHFKQLADLDKMKLARAIYHRVLADVNGALLEAATMQWLSTAHPFHPSPGELRDLALRLVECGEPSADEAWIEVLSAIKRVGSYGLPQWSNERIAQAVKAFGWFELCMTETDQLGIVRAQFMKIYEAQAKREHDDRLMLPETRRNVQQAQALIPDKAGYAVGQAARQLGAGG